MKTGSCVCGQVTLQLNSVLDTDLTVSGEEHLTWFRASDFASRGFCKHCGSLLFWKKDDTDYTSVMAGCIDGPTEQPLIKHIFVDEKGDYYELNDDVQKFSGTGES